MPKVIAFHNSDNYFNSNVLFSGSNPADLLYSFYRLKQVLQDQGFHVATYDMLQGEVVDVHVFNDGPYLRSRAQKQRFSDLSGFKILLLWECPLIRPDSYDKSFLEKFDRIFTWSSCLKNGDLATRISPLYFNRKLSLEKIYFKGARNRSGIVCVSANKRMAHASSLYNTRIDLIKYLENNFPDVFHLYGRGWGTYVFNSDSVLRILNPLLRRISSKLLARPSWMGAVEDKLEVLGKYNFCLCLENAVGYNGYITEKILDAFLSGCIPIYLGAPDVESIIPKNCFIDIRDYPSYESCLREVLEFDDLKIEQYRNNIRRFLRSKAAVVFDVEYFANTLSGEITRSKTKNGIDPFF